MLGTRPPKLVTTLHGTDITLVGQDRTFFEITKFGIERSDGVTAVSEFLKKMTVDEFQIANPPIQVIPNFVDLSSFSRTHGYRDRSTFAAAGQKILLHVSNFRPVKRPLDVVRILERVIREVPAVLLMVGEGPERASAQALARLGLSVTSGSSGGRTLEGAGAADMFYFPRAQSFGLSALEAMASGARIGLGRAACRRWPSTRRRGSCSRRRHRRHGARIESSGRAALAGPERGRPAPRGRGMVGWRIRALQAGAGRGRAGATVSTRPPAPPAIR